MSDKSAAMQHMRAIVLASQLSAVDAVIAEYEAEATEDTITSSEPEKARQRVLAAREIRALLKPPKGAGGQP